MNQKSRKKLINKLERYYTKNAESSIYFYPLAVLYYDSNEKEKAYQILEKGLRLFPRYLLALIKISQILIDDNKYNAALSYLETALGIQKDNVIVLKNMAELYQKMGHYDEELNCYEKIAAISGDENAKSKIMELAGKITNTDNIDKLTESIENEDVKRNVPEELVIKDLSEDISLTENKDTEEIPTIELEEEKSNDEEEEATITLAKLYEKQNYIEDAISIYKKILQKDSENTEAKSNLERLMKNYDE